MPYANDDNRTKHNNKKRYIQSDHLELFLRYTTAHYINGNHYHHIQLEENG